MSDLLEMPDQRPSNVIDLDEYRRQRVAEGTWPIPDEDYRKYWSDRRAKLHLPKVERT